MGQKLDKSARGAYDAIVYIDGSEVVAEDADGRKIASGVAGTDDFTVAQTTLTAYSDVLMIGSFFMGSGVVTPSKILRGLPGNPAILEFDHGYIKLHTDEKYIGHLKITGDPGYSAIDIRASNITVEDVLCDELGSYRLYAFFVYASDTIITGIKFINCEVNSGGRTGFELDGAGTTKIIDGIDFIECKAFDCGRYARYNNIVNGFVFVENNDLYNCNVIGCEAYGCWESGFHIEQRADKHGINFVGCNSHENGQSPTCVYGAGFLVGAGVSMSGCQSKSNQYGILFVGSDDTDAPSNISATTDSNIKCGLYGKANNAIMDIVSKNDGTSMFLYDACRNLNIRLISISPTIDGFRHESDTYFMDNCVLDVMCSNALSNYSGFFRRIQNSTINLVYLTTNNSLYGHHVSYCDNIDFRILGNGPGSGCCIDLFADITNSRFSGKCIGFENAIRMEAVVSGGSIFENMEIVDCINGINALSGATTGIVLNGIRFNNVINRVVGGSAAYVFYLKNSGSSTGTGSEQTIAHGLAAIPTGCKAWIKYLVGTRYHTEAIDFDSTNVYPTVPTGIAYEWRIE